MDLRNIILPAIFVGTTLLSLPIIHRVLRRHNERMRRVADELGFTYHGPGAESPDDPAVPRLKRWLQVVYPWRLTGTRDGVAVAIFLETRGSSRNKNSYSIVEASFPRPLPFTLLVGRETALARLGKAVFHIQDIEVGSERFDPEVRIRSSDPEKARSLLSRSGVQERILAALQESPTITVTGSAARWEKKGVVASAPVYQQAMDLVVPVVRSLVDAGAFRE